CARLPGYSYSYEGIAAGPLDYW
nr:immunoglobulin heavy chain junction region [Macaca mulatta]MOV89949.1 immunoglobulin heavy chain junction region [Macaca mulatta]MOV91386.1 immunoglobulin heavy chain junction region [Macaca mulatta]